MSNGNILRIEVKAKPRKPKLYKLGKGSLVKSLIYIDSVGAP